MNKTFLVSALAALVLGACGGSNEHNNAHQHSGASGVQTASDADDNTSGNQEATGELNLYVWSDYVAPATIEAFAKDTGIEINQAFYDSNEVLEAKVLTGKSGFDLVAPSISNVGRQIKAGAYRPIDKSQIPNYNNIDPELLKLMSQVDPGNKYAVPYFWGINTLAINTEQVAKALGDTPMPANEWDLVFNPQYTAKLKSCGISFFDSPTEQYPLVLKYMGKDPNSDNPADLEAANALLKQVRGDVKRFSSSGYIDGLANGDLCVAIGYGGDLNIAKRRAQEAGGKHNIQVLAPKTGVGIWIDSFMIPKDANNVANAHKYINYTLDPEVAAKNAAAVTFAPASLPAREKIDPKLVATRSIFPTAEDMAAGFVMPQMSDEAKRQTTALWQKLKMGK